MAAVESENEELKGVLPRNYTSLPNATLVELLRLLAPLDLEGDAFGKIYEYFLGAFAMTEGQKGGVFLYANLNRPPHRRDHRAIPRQDLRPRVRLGRHVRPERRLRPRAQEGRVLRDYHLRHREGCGDRQAREDEPRGAWTSGDIREFNTYYEDPHKSVGRFDFVMANPPFNVNGVDKERLKEGSAVPARLPATDNANYLWIQTFYSTLNEKGRAGFVMANSASDARSSEQEIRKKLIEGNAVDVVVSVGANMFYTVTLPCTLWFLDKGKAKTKRADTVLFLDARHIYRQISRAQRKFSPKQIEYLANIVRLYRGEEPEFAAGDDADYPGQEPALKSHSPNSSTKMSRGFAKWRRSKTSPRRAGRSIRGAMLE